MLKRPARESEIRDYSSIKSFLDALSINSPESRRHIEQLIKEGKEIFLEVGAGGKKGKDGWITIDINEKCDINWDLRQGIPFPQETISRIYSSHFLEHLSFTEGQKFLDECLRVLIPGGAFSVCVPNARMYIEAYLKRISLPDSFFRFHKLAFNNTTSIDYVNYTAYMYGQHKYMFDEENLLYILRSKGFTNVRLRKFDPYLDLEERDFESIYAEAEKKGDRRLDGVYPDPWSIEFDSKIEEMSHGLKLTIDPPCADLITPTDVRHGSGVEGFKEPEGPYPKSHLPRVRWAKSPRTTIEFYITHENKFDSVVLSMSFCPHVRPSARMTVKLNKEVIREYNVSGWDNWQDDKLYLKPQKGRNVIEFSFGGGADASAPPDSLHMLFRELSLCSVQDKGTASNLTDGPLVSILTPVYNASLYLDDCIDSVIAQTYRNWELLIIDDGSTDGSLQKAMEWAGRDSRIRVLHHPDNRNKGVSATRNLGINHAKGKYIALLDSDDLWLPEKLEVQISVMERDPELMLVYSKAITIDQDGVELTKSVRGYDFPGICGLGDPGRSDNAVEKYITREFWLPCSSVVMRSDVLRDVKGFDETLSSQVEDALLFTVISNKGPIYFMDEILAKYRTHPRSYTFSYPWIISHMEYYDRLYKNLSAKYAPVVGYSFDRFVRTVFVSLSSFNSSPSFRERETVSRTAAFLIRHKLSCYSYAICRIFRIEGLSIRDKLRFSLLLLKNLARQTVTPQLKLTVGSHQTNLITSKELSYGMGVKGLGEPEGPHPQLGLPRVRWAKSPRTTIEFYINGENDFDSVVLSMSFCPHIRPSARMTVTFNNEVIKGYDVAGWNNWHDEDLKLIPRTGSNMIEFLFPDAAQDSLYILFRKLSLRGVRRNGGIMEGTAEETR